MFVSLYYKGIIPYPCTSFVMIQRIYQTPLSYFEEFMKPFVPPLVLTFNIFTIDFDISVNPPLFKAMTE